MQPTRRHALALLAALPLASPALAQDIGYLTPAEARAQAQAGQAVLIDVREPAEWAESGVAEGASRINMRNPRIAAMLEAATGGDRAAPVALICHSGVRSKALAEAMARAGYTNVYSVEGGMFGSSRDPGWLRAGLPVTKGE